MRMWMVPVEQMCRKHLMGEHVETHMFVGTMNQGKSLQGYIDNGLVEVDLLQSRHDTLASEIERRGYNHNSPLIINELVLATYEGLGTVDSDNSLNELARRCEDCAELQQKALC